MTRVNLSAVVLLALILQSSSEAGLSIFQGTQSIEDNSFVQAASIVGADNALQCTTAGPTADVGWYDPNGNQIECNTSASSQLVCESNGASDTLSLYLNGLPDDTFVGGEYTCCIMGSCSGGNSKWIRVRIFDTQHIQDLFADLPQNISTVPQTYHVHCNVDNSSALGDLSLQYKLDDQPVAGMIDWCNTTDLLVCSKTMNGKLTVTWYASSVIANFSEVGSKNKSNGDHDVTCAVNLTTGVEEDAYIRIRAPNFPSSTNSFTISVTDVTATTASVHWTAPSYPPDADGYIIYYHEMGSEDPVDVQTQLISDSNSTGHFLTCLAPNTSYILSVRAFQDILGPPTPDVHFTTEDDEMSSGDESSMLVPDICSTTATYEIITDSTSELLPSQPLVTTSTSKSSQMTIGEMISINSISGSPTPIMVSSPSPSTSMEPASMPWLYPAVGAAAALSAALVSFTCCLLIIVVRMKKKKGSKSQPDEQIFLPANLPLPQRRQLRPQRISYVTKAHHLLSIHSHPLSITELGRAVLDIHGLHDEYMSIPSNMVTMNEIPTGADDKNRYGDVLPNPHSRVALFLKFGVGNSDYINANYIRGFDGSPKAYIATQGPLPWTMADFWRMVWEQKSTVIIMVTGLEERGLVKCAQYWPDTARHVTSDRYGDIEVTIQRRTSTPTYTLTNFQIKHVEREVVRDVVHYWYTAWPDHGVPETSDEMLDFILASRRARDSASMPGPVVVHCSAGIGRTGVFISADMGMRELEQDNSVDVQRILASMRQDRGGMIQTKDQYVFLHRLLYEYARRINVRRESCPNSPDDKYLLSTPDITDPVTCDA